MMAMMTPVRSLPAVQWIRRGVGVGDAVVVGVGVVVVVDGVERWWRIVV